MNTFTNKLDALSDNFQSELDKLHKAIREEVEKYIKQELENNGVMRNNTYSIEYYKENILFEIRAGGISALLMIQIENDLNTLDHTIKQAFEIPHTFTY